MSFGALRGTGISTRDTGDHGVPTTGIITTVTITTGTTIITDITVTGTIIAIQDIAPSIILK